MKKNHRRGPASSPGQPEPTPTPPLQAMGGKEDRISQVGQARAEAERREKDGEVGFDLAPGPGADELLHGHRRPASWEDKTRFRRRKVSPKPRGGPIGLEPEDKGEAPRTASGRHPDPPLPFDHGESED